MTTNDKLSCEDLGSDYLAWLDEQGDLSEDAEFNAWLDEQAALTDADERLTPGAF